MMKQQWASWALIGCVLVWLAMTTPALVAYPSVHMDEGWMVAMALNFARTGNFGLPIIGDISGTTENYIHNGRVYTAAMAGWLSLVGVGVFQARLAALFGLLVSVSLTYQLGRRLFNPTVGLLAAVMFLYSWRALYAGHFQRPDTWVAAVGLAYGFAAWHWRSAPPYVHFWFGLGALLLADLYSSMVFQVVMLGGLMLYLQANRAGWRRLVGFGCGAALGLIGWVALRAWPDPMLAYAQYKFLATNNFGVGNAGVFAPLIKLFSSYLDPWIYSASRIGPLEAVYLLVGVVGTLGRWDKQTTFVRVAAVGFILAFIYTVASVTLYHLISWMPWLYLLLAVVAMDIGLWLRGKLRGRLAQIDGRVWGVGLLLPLVGLSAVGSGYLAWGSLAVNRGTDYIDALRELVPHDANLLGNGAWYLGFYEHGYTDYWYMNQYDKLPLAESVSAAGFFERTLDEREITHVLIEDGYLPPDILAMVAEECAVVGAVEIRPFGLDEQIRSNLLTTVYVCGD